MQTNQSQTTPAKRAVRRSSSNALGRLNAEHMRTRSRHHPRNRTHIRICCPSRRFLVEQESPEAQLVAANIWQTSITPLDAWWAIEDLWCRIAQYLAVEVRSDESGDQQLIFHGFRHWTGREARELRYCLLDTERYGWHVDDSEGCRAGQGARGSLVRMLDYEGDSLKVTLTPYRQIERAPQGTEVSFFIRAYLLELQIRGHCVSRDPNLNKLQQERHMAHITSKPGLLTPSREAQK